nr:HNH endonuclease signature motif containing protein [Williamsia soli]
MNIATDADHIVNIKAGGSKYDPNNLQSLCRTHHDQKTRSEAKRGQRRRSEGYGGRDL